MLLPVKSCQISYYFSISMAEKVIINGTGYLIKLMRRKHSVI